MHELAIAQSVVEGVCERVRGARITRVILEIGKLSGVEPEAIRFCFDACAQGTPVEGAALEIVEPPGRARCRACDRELDLPDPLAACACGSLDVSVIAGEQLLVRAVEVA